MRPPDKENSYQASVNHCAEGHERGSTHELHDGAEEKRTRGIHHSEAYHYVTHVVDSQGAGDVSLEHRTIVSN